jgi:hypothetical protein
VVVVYLVSLNLEAAAGILKAWKNGEEEESNFYYNDFQDATPNRWLLKEMVSKVKR